MRVGDTNHAVETALAIQKKVPYDAEVALALRYMKTTLDPDTTWASRQLEENERPTLLVALNRGVALAATHSEAQMSTGDLFESGLELAYAYRFDGQGPEAAAWLKEMDAALGTAPALSAADQSQVDAARKRYALMGQHLPTIQIQKSFAPPTAKAVIDWQSAKVTILVLFPDWCTQCRKMMKDLSAFAVANADTPIHAYGLVYSQKSDSPTTPDPVSAEELTKDLQGTNTFLVPASTAQTFAATDFPLGIMLSAKGTVRTLGVLPIDAFRSDSYLEKMIHRRVLGSLDPEPK
jgi:thiol-disulfide isomerase/thioredoxin